MDKTTVLDDKKWMIDRDIITEYLCECQILLDDESAMHDFRVRPAIRRAICDDDPKSVSMFWKQASLLCDVEELIESCHKADAIGSPLMGSIGSGVKMSGETARFALQFAILRHLFGSLDGMRIVEVGGGYGGLACILLNQHPSVHYTCYDLPIACELQQRYLKASSANLSGADWKSEIDDSEYDIGFSFCAFAEFSTETMKTYATNIFAKTKTGVVQNSAGRWEPERLCELLTTSMDRTVHRVCERSDSYLFPGNGVHFCCWG